MAREFARDFYSSVAWKNARARYKRRARGLCERCLQSGMIVPGVIVHHKDPITEENVGDPAVTLNFDNLQLLCRECHEKVHEARERRYEVDENGKVRAT